VVGVLDAPVVDKDVEAVDGVVVTDLAGDDVTSSSSLDEVVNTEDEKILRPPDVVMFLPAEPLSVLLTLGIELGVAKSVAVVAADGFLTRIGLTCL